MEVRSAQVEAVGKLLEEGATVPFIARYRKEATGNLDEVQIIAIRDRLEQLKALDERRAAVLKSIEEQGKLTPELKEAIEAAETLARVEDLYLPYKPKKETRADKARKRGLEPLAEKILEQSDFDVKMRLWRFRRRKRRLKEPVILLPSGSMKTLNCGKRRARRFKRTPF